MRAVGRSLRRGVASARSARVESATLLSASRFVSFGVPTARGNVHEVLSGPLLLGGVRVGACSPRAHTRGRESVTGCVFIARRRDRYVIEELRESWHQCEYPIAPRRSVINCGCNPRETVTMIGCRDFGQGSRKLWPAEYGLRSQYEEQRPEG